MNANNHNETHVILGSGPVGLSLADLLIARGKKVRLVSRSGKANAPAGVEVRAANAMDPTVLAELCSDAAVVYHCMNAPSYAEQVEIIPKMQKVLIPVVGASGASLIVTDTLYMYGETHGKVMTEDSPYNATSRKGMMRAQVARDFLKAHKEGKVRVALGRAADFYGPGVTNSSLGYTVFPPIMAGKPAQVLGNINLPHSYSYIKDVARGLATLGEKEEALGQEWLLPVVPAVSVRKMLDLVQEDLGSPVRTQAIPKFAVQAIGLFNPTMRELVEMFYQYTEAQIVDSSRFEAAFGWKATPLEDGIRETVAWFRQSSASK